MNNVLQEHRFGDHYIIEIKNDLSIKEFTNAKKKIGCKTINLNILWNAEKQCIDKGVLFVCCNKGILYNIFTSKNFYKIDERHQIGEICMEKVLMVHVVTRKYHYSFMKHNEFGSTIFTRSFSNNSNDISNLNLSAQEAYDDIQQLVSNLLGIMGIENIINWAEFCEIIYDDIYSKIDPTIKQKEKQFF